MIPAELVGGPMCGTTMFLLGEKPRPSIKMAQSRFPVGFYDKLAHAEDGFDDTVECVIVDHLYKLERALPGGRFIYRYVGLFVPTTEHWEREHGGSN